MTKSRKRMLLSSIAMLLVALVALGSATYAWFTVQRTVTADTMQVTAIAKKGIEISIDNGGTWSTTTQHFTAGSYEAQPVSWDSVSADNGWVPAKDVTDSDNGTYTETGEGAYKTAGTYPTPVSTTSVEAVSADADSTYFRTYRVSVRSAEETGGYTPHDISAAVTISGQAASYARVALVDGSNVYTYSNDTSGLTAANNQVVTAATGTKTGVATLGNAALQAVTGTADTGAATNYILVVWFEGTDGQCIDDNADKSVSVSVSFTATDM